MRSTAIALGLLTACAAEVPEVQTVGEFALEVRVTRGEAEFVGGAGVGRGEGGLAIVPVVKDGAPGRGPAETIELVTRAVSFDCGLPNTFCADVELASFFAAHALTNLHVEVTEMVPSTGHEVVNGLTVLGPDAIAAGVRLTFGVLDYPDVPPGGSALRRWAFGNDGTDFWLRGRVLADRVAVGGNRPPVAVDDAFDGVGNTALLAGGLLDDDADPDLDPLAVTPGVVASAAGGEATLAADGSFVYVPPVGFQGEDTFDYEVVDGRGGADTGRATVTVGGMVWYVDNTAAPPGDGRSVSPFPALASAEAASDVGHVIDVAAGDGTATGQSAGVDLKPGQTLRGAGRITNGPGLAVVRLASGVTVRGVTLASDGAAGVYGRGIDSATIDGVTFAAARVELRECAGTVRISGSSSADLGALDVWALDIGFVQVEVVDSVLAGAVEVFGADGFATVVVRRSSVGGVRCDSDFGNGGVECVVEDSTLTGDVGLFQGSTGWISGRIVRATFAPGASVLAHLNASLLRGGAGSVEVLDSQIDGPFATPSPAVQFSADGASYEHQLRVVGNRLGTVVPVPAGVYARLGSEAFGRFEVVGNQIVSDDPAQAAIDLRSGDGFTAFSALVRDNAIENLGDPARAFSIEHGVDGGFCLDLEGNDATASGVYTIRGGGVEELADLSTLNVGIVDVSGASNRSDGACD